MVIPMLKIRRSYDRLIFNMGIPIPVRRGLYIETGPRRHDIAYTTGGFVGGVLIRSNGAGIAVGAILCEYKNTSCSFSQLANSTLFDSTRVSG